MAGLQLGLTDLRAHFEAQLRTVKRAEECLMRCRHQQDFAAFDGAVALFRDQLALIAQDRLTIGVLLDQVVSESRQLATGGRSPKA
jgi:hypothetical protein